MSPKRMLRAALGAVVVLLGGAMVAARIWPHGPGAPLLAALQAVQAWSRQAWWAFLVLQLVIVLSGVVPASLVGVTAGAVYGPVAGFAMAAFSTLLGAVIAFALARSALRPAIAGLLARRPALARIDRAVSRDGWRSVCLLRVSPVMPFAVTSYALGLTGLSLRAYLLGTLAALPALLGYVVLGWLGSLGVDDAGRQASLTRWALLGVGVVATVVLIVHVGRVLARAVRNGN